MELIHNLKSEMWKSIQYFYILDGGVKLSFRQFQAESDVEISS